MLTNIEVMRENDGTIYYVIPSGYPLFKATKTYDPMQDGLSLNPDGFYFFGVKNENPSYIRSYEKEYGIVFEFITNRSYKLLALDKKETQTNLYKNAPREIQVILENNYGYINNLRNSETNNDHKLSEYICKLGYQGYAIQHMSTSFEGSFHPEFMFCDISGIRYVKRVTSDVRVKLILKEEQREKYSRELREQRKNKRDQYFSNENNYNNENNHNNLGEDEGKDFKPKTLFMEELGGAKRKSYKRKKKNTRKTKKNIRKTGKMKRNTSKSKSKKYK